MRESVLPIAYLSKSDIHYQIHGSHGSFVVLIMGLGMSAEAWQLQINELSRKHRVLSFDNPGIARSTKLKNKLTTKNLAAISLELLRSLEIESYHLVGVSLGGMIAQELFMIDKESVLSLSLITTKMSSRSQLFPNKSGLYHFIASFFGSRRSKQHHLTRLLFSDEFIRYFGEDLFLSVSKEKTGRPLRLFEIIRQIKAVFLHDGTNISKHCSKAGILIVSAERDSLIEPKESLRLFCSIPNAKLIKFKSAGHGLILEVSERLNQVLLALFKENE